jgi:PhnB protein
MKWNPYLSFNGQCEEAFKFYQKILGGKILMMMTYADSPMAAQAPAGMGRKVIHATFALDDQTLSGADVPPDRYRQPQGFSVVANLDTAVAADRIFSALSENGEVQMPIQETFWALRFGMLVDRFGTPWMINCGKPA